MNRRKKMFHRVFSKWDPILSMLCLACLVLMTLVAADQMYIDDQISRLREPSSLKYSSSHRLAQKPEKRRSSSHNGHIGVESTHFKKHFNVTEEPENQSVNKIIKEHTFPEVINSDFNSNNADNYLSNDINNENNYKPINKTQTHQSHFESYKTIISLLFDTNPKYNHETTNSVNVTELNNTYDNIYNNNHKTIAPIFSEKSNPGSRKSKTSSKNRTEVPWEIQFATDRADHGTWRAYFYDQAIAVMLQDDQEYVYNCTLIEVIKLYEQRQAHQRLGKLMPLVPVSMPAMVHLITLCGSLDVNVQKVQQQSTQADVPMWWMSGNLLRGLMPGTLWCGMGDAAENYHQLGYLHNLDNCCRAHDHCPIKLRPLMNRYGLTNLAVNTKSHCSCDLEFFRCLKSVGSEISKRVGEVYFNYLQVQCIDEPAEYLQFGPVRVPSRSISAPSTDTPGNSDDTSSRLRCIMKDVDGACRMWIPNPKSLTQKLVIKDNHLVY